VRLYTQKVLPLLAALHYFAFRDEAKCVIDVFVEHAPEELAMRTLETILKYFPLTRSKKAIDFVTLLGELCEITEPDCVRPVAGAIAFQLTRCAAFGHQKLVEALVPVWLQPPLSQWLADNAAGAYPTVCAVLSQALDAARTLDLKANIGKMMPMLSRLNATAYQHATKQKGAKPSAVQHKRRGWSAIIRNASKYPEFDIRRIIADVQTNYSEAGPSIEPRNAALIAQPMPAKSSSLPPPRLTPVLSRT
jgi:hypothetical protein